MPKQSVSWVVMDHGMFCRRCGACQQPTINVPLDDFLAEMGAFVKEHAECPEVYPFPRPAPVG